MPVSVNHAFHKLPPFDSWLFQEVCWMHFHLTPLLDIIELFSAGSSSDSIPIYHAKYDLFYLLCPNKFSFLSITILEDVSLAFHSSPHSLSSVANSCAVFAWNISSWMPSVCLCLVSSVSMTHLHTARYWICLSSKCQVLFSHRFLCVPFHFPSWSLPWPWLFFS